MYICVYICIHTLYIFFVVYILCLGQSPLEGLQSRKTTLLFIFTIEIRNVQPYHPTIFHGLFQFRRLHKEKLEVFLYKLRTIPINLHI